MYFNSEQLISFFTTSTVNERVKENYHSSLPWEQAGIDGGVRRDSWGDVMWAGGGSVSSFDYRAVDMEKVVEVMHERIANGKFLNWKALRPWVVCDVTADLAKDEAWIGWEIETGWNSQDERYTVMNLFNQRYMHSCTDDEGYGEYQVELTFSPQTPGFYAKRDNPLHPLLFVANHKERARIHNAGAMVGTHVNFSTPSFREADYATMQRVEGALNNSLGTLTYMQKEELFGRGNLYAGCFLRGNNDEETGSGVMWIEGKLFNSTYEWDVAKQYILVAERLCSVMEQLAAQGTALGIVKVVNFYDVLVGNVTGIETERTSYLRDGDEVNDGDDDYDDEYEEEYEDDEPLGYGLPGYDEDLCNCVVCRVDRVEQEETA